MGDFNIHGSNLHSKNKFKKYSFNLVEEELALRHITHNRFENHEFPTFISFQGFNTPDHVFSRGIDVNAFVSNRYTASDHNLIVAEIKIENLPNRIIMRHALHIKNINSKKAILFSDYLEKCFIKAHNVDYNAFVNIIQKSYNLIFRKYAENTVIKRQLRKILKYNNSLKVKQRLNELSLQNITNYTNKIELSRDNIDTVCNNLFKHQKVKQFRVKTYRKYKLSNFTMEEFNLALKQLKLNKSPGLDGVTFEILLLLQNKGKECLLNIYNMCLNNLVMPNEWLHSITIPITKKNNKLRPIVLLSSLRKLFEKLIYNRMINIVTFCKSQGGFRKNNNTLMHNLALEFYIANLRDANKRVLAFLDIKKAYDTVNRKLLYKKMHKNLKLRMYIPLIQALFEQNTTQLYWNMNISHNIHLNIGLVQGSVLSPLLYNIFISDLECLIENNPNNKILIYADDIALVSNSRNNAQISLNTIYKYAKKNKFKFNHKKSVCIMKDTNNLLLGKKILNIVNNYSYLGIYTDIRGFNIKEQLHLNWIKTLKHWRVFIKSGAWNNNMDSISLLNILTKSLLPKLEWGLFLGVDKSSLMEEIDSKRLKLIRSALKLPKISNSNMTFWLSGIKPYKEKAVDHLKRLLLKSLKDTNITALNMELKGYANRIKHRRRKQLDVLLNISNVQKKDLFNDFKTGRKYLAKIEKLCISQFIKKYITSSFIMQDSFVRNKLFESQEELKFLFENNMIGFLLYKHKDYLKENNYI